MIGLRAGLAHAVAERPGIGGAEWNRAIEEHREFLAKIFASDASRFAKGSETGRREFKPMDRSFPLRRTIRGAGQRIGRDLRSHGALGEGSIGKVRSAGRDEGAIWAIGVSGQ